MLPLNRQAQICPVQDLALVCMTHQGAIDMDKELNALRRVAKAAKLYQEKVIQKRKTKRVASKNLKESTTSVMDIGSAEFELSEALNAWYRTQTRAN